MSLHKFIFLNIEEFLYQFWNCALAHENHCCRSARSVDFTSVVDALQSVSFPLHFTDGGKAFFMVYLAESHFD